MNTSTKALISRGRFQWNRGGWFGSLLGSSAWMLVTSIFLLFYSQPFLAALPLGGFAVVTFASYVLWSRRDRIYPYPAMMAMLGLFAILMPVVWMAISSNASPSSLEAMNWPVDPRITAVVFAIFPIGMVWFTLLEWSAKLDSKERSPSATKNVP